MNKMSRRMEVRAVKVVNKKDVDIVVRDFCGQEHVLFPKQEKEVVLLVRIEESRDDRH
jgi:hypothetical protein